MLTTVNVLPPKLGFVAAPKEPGSLANAQGLLRWAQHFQDNGHEDKKIFKRDPPSSLAVAVRSRLL